MRKSIVPVLIVLAVSIPASAKKEAKPQALNGEAIVRTIGDDRVAVLLDTNDDQAIDQGFLLSSDLPVPSTSTHCPGATVEFTDSYVRVTFGSKVVDLYVAGYPEPPELAEKKDMTKFVGYALQHSAGGSGCTLERAMTDAGACYDYGK